MENRKDNKSSRFFKKRDLNIGGLEREERK